MNRLRTRLRASIASGPLVLLDFISGGLDPRITFSRGSNATLVDATGKITYAPANLLTYSEQFDNAAWTKSNTTVTPNVSDPLGGTTADTVTATTANGHILQQVVLGAGINAIPSIWVRRRTGTGAINMWNATGTTVNVTSQITTEWSRVFVPPVACSSGPFLFLQIVTSGDAVDVWGAQLEPVTYQTTPGTYNTTTASAYYGPRFDYDPVTLAPKGLLIEEARTNLLTYSGAVGGTNWNTSAATPTLNSIMAPDGTTTATLVTENTAASNHSIFGTNASLTVATHTASAFIKAGTRRYVSIRAETTAINTYAWITFDTTTGAINANAAVTSSSATAVGNGWWRVTLTWANTQVGGTGNVVFAGSDVSTAPIVSSVLGNSYTGTSSTFYVWGAQVEAGSFATSYIPTVASTVTRSADVATMTGTNFSTWYNFSEGAYVYEYIRAANTSGVGGRVFASGVGGSNSYGIWVNQNTATQDQLTIRDISGDAVSGVSFNVNSTGVNKGAVAYKVNDFAWDSNGGTVATDTTGVVPSLSDQLRIGRAINSDSAFLNGHIRAIAYYNTRLPNAQLQTLTAPSLATTLTMSFTDQAYTVGV